MPCISCGYDLIGLDETGLCPECGSRVADSVMGEGLAFVSPDHLEKIRRGLHLTRLGVGLILGVWGGAMVLGIVWGLVGLASLSGWGVEALVILAMMATLGVFAAGCWLATTPDPRLADYARSRSALAARWTAVAMAALPGCFMVAALILPAAVTLAMPTLGLFALAHYGASAAYLRVLARCAGNARAAAHARGALIAVLVVLGASIAQVLIDAMGLSIQRGGLAGSLARFLLSTIPFAAFFAAIVAIARQFTAAGLIRDDLRRFLFHAQARR